MSEGVFVYGIYASIALLLITLVLFRKIKLEYNKSLIMLLALFVFTSVISAFFNSDRAMVFDVVVLFSLFIATSVISHSYLKDSTGKVVVFTLLLSHVPIIIIPLIRDGLGTFPYMGIFDNPNSFGLVAVTVFAVFLALFLSKLEKRLFYIEKPSRLIMLLYFFLATLSFLVVVFSASRTSFLAGIIVSVIGLFFIVLFSIKNKLAINLLFKAILGLPIIWGLYLIVNKYIPLRFYIDDIILSKFDRKSSNVLDGRNFIWEKTIGEAKIFGNGTSYFNDQIGLGAHNTFIHVLGVYGWLPMIMFTLFIAVALYYCIRFVFSDNDYKYLPLIIFTIFLALSMGENQFYRVTMIASFILIGLVANNKRVAITS